MIEIDDLSPYRSMCKLDQKIVVSVDKGNPARHHRANNRKQLPIWQYHIDGDVISGDAERCDYLLLIEDEKHSAYLIELKGRDVDKAVRQIVSTEKILRKVLSGCTVNYRIASSRITHSVRSTPTVARFLDRYGDRAIIRNGNIEEFVS